MVFIFLFLSCQSTYYFQLFTISYEPQFYQTNDAIIYEDSTCRLLLNFWDVKGKLYITFFNNLNENIILNLDETFFINNMFAIPFFQNRSFESQVTSFQRTVTYLENFTNKTNSADNIQTLRTFAQPIYSTKVIYKENNVAIIPPKSYINIYEPHLNIVPYYYDSNLLEKYPEKPRAVDFIKSNSPFVFRLRFSFETSNTKQKYILDKEFFISSIINMHQDEFFKIHKTYRDIYYYPKYESPNRFFIIYK
ncbi:MAG: hypothetical protein ACPLPX_05480 [Candidatus Kapaibacteriota bacterium]